jgi:DNA-binding response OmpR family regulator
VQHPIRILVVDDDPDTVRLFWLILAKDGFEIMTAFDGRLALEEVREIQPDLILLDVMMPGGLDGIEVCRQVRADPTLNEVSVIMVSARSDAETQTAARAAGANDYWVKPISRDGLVTRVHAALAAQRASSARLAADAGTQPDDQPALESIVKLLPKLTPNDLGEIQSLVVSKLAQRER